MDNAGFENILIYVLIAAVIAYVLFQTCTKRSAPSRSAWGPHAEQFADAGRAANLAMSADLLPKENADTGDWAQFAPKPSAELAGVALLDPVKFLGQSTSGVAKNSSTDIRSTISVAKREYPWNNSSLEPSDFTQHISVDAV